MRPVRVIDSYPGCRHVTASNAPSLIVHYVDARAYPPPAVFQRAVLECPEIRSTSNG